MITAEQIKQLRDQTGISIGECKKALEAAEGDVTKALELLKVKSGETAGKKADRTLKAGRVSAYIHNTGNMGTLVELACETDFVAKNPEFKMLADDVAMHIAAMMPADTAELLAQPFVKDPATTVDAIIKNHIQKFGERIEVGRFARIDASQN